MAYSRQDAVSDGTLQVLDIAIQYMRRADIFVLLDDVETEDWGWVGVLNSIAFPAPLAAGVRVTVIRRTRQDKVIHEFAKGALFNSTTMDTDFRQMLYLAQEYTEGGGFTDIFSDLNMHGFRLTNLGPGIAPNDAVTKAQLDAVIGDSASGLRTELASSSGSGLIGWLRDSANAILRTVSDKLSDVVSVMDFEAKGDGVTDDTNAILRATQTGKSVYFPAGTYRMLGTVQYTGRVIWYSYGDATIVSDIDVLVVTNGKNSRVTDLDFVNFTAPQIITRDDFGVLIGGIHTGGPGYQPTVNDGDIWPSLTPTQQNQDIGPKISFKGNASNIVVSGLTGEFLSILLYDTVNSRVKDCTFRAGKNFAGGIVFWNIDGQAGNNNKATNNVVSYASYSGIIFARNYNGAANSNTVTYCGESGIKTYQNNIGAVDARCYRMLVNDNTISFPQYDGLDLATDYPITGLKDSRHIAVGNDVYGAGQTGLHIDGYYCLVASNRFRACGSNGMSSILNKSKIHGNELIDNNARNVVGKNHMDITGDFNSIVSNSIITSGRNGAALYAPGTNTTKNNSSPDGAMFFGNTGSITSTLFGNTDSLATHMSTLPIRQRQDAFAIPALEIYTENSLASGAINWHPLHQQVRNPSAQIRGYCTNAVDNLEAGALLHNVAIGGALKEGLRVQSHSSVGAYAFPVMSSSLTPIDPAFLENNGHWTVAVQPTRLAFSVKLHDGTTKMAYLNYA